VTAASPGSGGGARGLFVCSRQLGCPANLALTTRLHNWAAANGWELRHPETADYLILVACSILVEYRRGGAAAVEYLARAYPRTQIVVTGCSLPADEVAAPNVAYLPWDRVDELDQRLGATVSLASVSSVSTAEEDRAVGALGRGPAVYEHPYNVLVTTGCLCRCHYCIEPTLFPTVTSLPLDEVVAECRAGLAKGYRSFLIGGSDVSSYGQDLGCDLRDLFAALFSQVFGQDETLGLGFKALEPSRFIRYFADLKGYFARHRIDWIYLPLESGSDRVLQEMNRKYRVADVLAVVAELRALAPRLRIETDFVICYPTETAADFEASLGLLDHFDHWNLVPFGRHEHTKASALVDVFGPEERARRCAVASELTRRQGHGYRPECRTLDEVQLPESLGELGIVVLTRHLAAKPL
jgi:tRNA A37 methylthiotransferase MiaB